MEIDSTEFLTQLPPGMVTCFVVMGFVLWGAFWAIFAFFFQNNLAAIPETCRRLSPRMTWWLVPFPVAFVFLFVVVARISDSWRACLISRGNENVGGCGKSVGMTSATLAILSNALSLQIFMGGGKAITALCQTGSAITGLIGFILLIVYAIVINDLKLKTQEEEKESASR